MLEEHGVRVYLNGHDHDFQHIAVDGVNYITCGGGADAARGAQGERQPVRALRPRFHGGDADEGGFLLLLRRR